MKKTLKFLKEHKQFTFFGILAILIILAAITVSIRIIHRIAGTGTPNTIVRIISEIIASLCILGFALFTYRTIG